MASVPYDGDSLVPLSEVLDFYTTVDNPGAGHNHNPCDRNEAPEFDSSADAAELDTHALGLEVAMDHRPEVLYRRSLPEALNSDSLSTNTLESNRISKRQPVYSLLRNTFRTRKKIQVILVLMLLVCAAIGIGLGMKFGRGKPAPTDSLPFTTTPDPLKDSRHQILNDTSLASVIDSNNDRHLFFQENTGVIRHLWYLDSSWKTSVDFTAASDAKNHTPMAAVIAESYYIALIYINNTNFITCQGLTNGKWEPCPWPPDSEHPRAAAVGSRHLSAIQFSGNASEFLTVHGANVSYQTILFYESEEFVTTAFVETATYTNMLSSIYSWTQLRLPDFMDYTSLDTPKTNYTIPFALTRARYDDSQSFLFLSNVNTSFPQSFLGSFDADDGNFVRGQQSDDYLIHDSDVVMMSLSLGITVFQVDGTELVSESRGPLANKPKNSFPFKRLASSNQENSTTVYLYHQLDEVTFAEEVYDSSRGLWTTAKNITIEA